MRTVTSIISKFLAKYETLILFHRVYKAKPKFWNYALIGVIGVLINQIILHFSIQSFPLWQADLLAIAVAWMWNYQNALGYFSKYWGMKDEN